MSVNEFSEAETARLKEIGQLSDKAYELGSWQREKLELDLSWASSRIEGCGMRHIDAQVLIEYGRKHLDNPDEELDIVINHVSAIKYALRRREDSVIALSGIMWRLNTLPRNWSIDYWQTVQEAVALSGPFNRSLYLLMAIEEKKTARVACNLSLLANNLAPMTFVLVCDSSEEITTKNAYAIAYIQTALRFRHYHEDVRKALHSNWDEHVAMAMAYVFEGSDNGDLIWKTTGKL